MYFCTNNYCSFFSRRLPFQIVFLKPFQLNESNLTENELFDMQMKLRKLNSDEKARLVWMWIKQDHINLKEFQKLLPYLGE